MIAAIGAEEDRERRAVVRRLCQKRLAEKRDFRCAVQPACSAELAMMCSAATWKSGSGVISTSSRRALRASR